ncbi:hypothetical protein FJ987_27845 [Mesorhizobium sp. CU2]|uniref:hypothetical protein n=1 Tax=unclassified Mesorhizobium TaxID=325217 RepID=UPI00112627C0|nr:MULTISPECIES: hypothetical protein [unclassified Mesorhizobium]TPN80934.1 hypothetical protein FJ988_20900 [Mesorhizobium sp. CU3]TPO03411.1 hypothetical protein FJ987_27845 [Mesorhizobium sp. CU2]
MEDRDRWILHIKEVRARHGVSLLEAERIALSDPLWRRWVERQINTDERCRKFARTHMAANRQASLVYRDGEVLKLR